MSRCFPYPPPGYTPSRASNEALIESIKLQKEREKAKAKAERKKEKKREKKEKKKSKEEKTKQIKSCHLDHDDVYRVENGGHCKEELPGKGGKDDTEQLERSSITEEHEQPVCSQNPSYSSDSTQNSGKRKRHASPVNGTRVQGNILRIRLPSQKNIKHDIIGDTEEQPIRIPAQKLIRHGGEEHPIRLPSQKHSEEQLCSTSGRTEELPEDNNNFIRADNDKSYPTSLASQLFVKDDPLSPVKWRDDIVNLQSVHTDSTSKRYRKFRKVADRYRDLIESWIPPSMSTETTDDDEEDWLLGRKNGVLNRSEKMSRGSTDMSCSSSCELWPPRARYLPEADIYALPYTVPF